MADWPNITDTQCDPDAPVTSNLMYGLRDAPIAIAEGAPGAPRNMLASLHRLVAGDTVRATGLSGSSSLIGSGTATASLSFGVIQFGSLRVVTSGSGSSSCVVRKRGGSNLTISSSLGTVDVSCIPGDLFTVTSSQTFGAGGGTVTVNASLRTNGADLWPSEGLWGYITGNSAAP